MIRKLFFALLIFLTFFSCQKKKGQPPIFSLVENSGIEFTNEIHNTKDFNIFSYRNYYNGGGVAIGDLNNDGLADVFFTANMSANKLYINKGNFQFNDITEKSGFKSSGKWATGVVLVDINYDGWLDIYICNAGFQKGIGTENELYINNGPSTSGEISFTEKAKEYGLADDGYTTHASFFDYDGDGDLDCYILNNSFIPVNTLNYANKRNLPADEWPVADFLKGGGDKLFRNDEGKFVDVTKEAGIYSSLIGFGLGITVGDLNGDLYPDLYISNDFFERDYLYINQKNGTFKEDLEQWMQHTSNSSMGADIADVNNDGYPDIFTTDMLPSDDYRLKTTTLFESIEIHNLKVQSGFYYQYLQNTLQVNNGNGKFMETAFYSGVAASDWSWGGLIFDADNDGLSDLFVCNGIYHDVTDQDFIDFFANDIIQNMVMTGQKNEIEQVINKMPSNPIPNNFFKNKGALKFEDQTKAFGLDQPSFSNGAAYGDLDNDGDLDLVVNNVNAKAFIYKNQTIEEAAGGYIGFSLKGIGSNTFAIGSTIKVFAGNEILTREIIPSRGFQSSVDYKVLVGLGSSTSIDSVLIYWPDRSIQKLDRPLINTVHTIQKNETISTWKPHVEDSTSIFKELNIEFEKHEENNYVDFYHERGVPLLLSREGPKAATGDVNGDGLMDIFIGGAAGQPAQLYLQKNETFARSDQRAFQTVADYEDVATLLFDCDGDGDLDLFVASGGNESPAFSRDYLNRLYINDGSGNFQIVSNSFPNTGMNTSCVAAADFDGDGDLDLFVGSRSVPQQYGISPKNYLFINNGKGKFSEAEKNQYLAIANAGMITDATWADVNNDQKPELILVGDWIAPRIFTFDDKGAQEITSNLQQLNGWWSAVEAADLNNDGHPDLVLGNLGENFYLQATPESPIKLWIKDFDENGTIEKIITQRIDGKDKPVFLKKELTEQIASLRKQNLKYIDFAGKSIQELFTKEQLNRTVTREVTYTASIIALNDGKGNFSVQKLPWQVQLSNVNAIVITDLQDDGKPDLVMGGNNFGFLPQFSRLDASYGHVLLNEGSGKFSVVQHRQSGIGIRGQIRDIKLIQVGNKKNAFIFLQNNEVPVWYQLNDVWIQKK